MTMIIEIDGTRTELDVSDCTTPEQINARLEGAGFGQHIRAMTAEDIEQAERIRAAYVAQAQRDEAATVERLAKVFLAARCKATGESFDEAFWGSMFEATGAACSLGSVLYWMTCAARSRTSEREEREGDDDARRRT